MNIHSSYPISNKINFQRRLKEDEKSDYSKSINDALDYLGINTRALIIHGSSFPAENIYEKNIDSCYAQGNIHKKNPYIGTPYFNQEFLKFAKMNGFNTIQLGPNGKLGKKENSPYRSSIFAKNELFINFDKLKNKEYANILSDNDTDEIKYIRRKYHQNYDMTDFDSAKEISDTVLHKAYKNFNSKLKNNDESVIRLNNEFSQYKEKNKNWLEKNSIFQILSNIYGTDDFNKWDNELDKNLISGVNNNDKASKIRYTQLITTPVYRKNIDEYEFRQFLADKQEKEDKTLRKKEGIKFIGDLLVGYSNSDEWSNPDAFMTDWRVGAMNGGKNGGPQLWDIPVLNPDKLFNKDGSLGVSGQLIKDKIDHVLEGVEGIRIDNVMGLVDPYIYKSSCVKKDGTIDYSNRGYMSHINEVDTNTNYPKILHNILLPSLKEHNISPKDVVWEDLGPQSQIFKEVFYEGKFEGKTYPEEQMQGIMYSKGVKMENHQGTNYSFMATHDNEPSARMLNENWIYENEGWNPMYLAGYLIPPINNEQRQKSERFCQKIEQNQNIRLKAKYAELFRGTSNIQIPFFDFFGIDKVYNYAGRDDMKENWKLRLNSNYEDTYYKSLETEEEPAMNMPEILELAVNSKSSLSKIHKLSTEEENKKAEKLQSDLNHWKNILKEPEQDCYKNYTVIKNNYNT